MVDGEADDGGGAMIRIGLILFGLLLCGWKFTTGFLAGQDIRKNGEIILFELAPVDPRELFLGDYMTLNYDISRRVFRGRDTDFVSSDPNTLPRKGKIIITVDEDSVGRFDRQWLEGDKLTDYERLIRYTRPTNRLQASIGGERYYFQSGTGERYEAAEYAIFRVMPDGRALLTGLADKEKRPILVAGGAPLKDLNLEAD